MAYILTHSELDTLTFATITYNMATLIQLLVQDIAGLENSFYRRKRQWAKSLGRLVKDSEVLQAYRSLLAAGSLTSNSGLENILRTRSIRTESGVTPFAVMTKPYICPGQCTFCPLELGMPKSYLSDEPAAARAKSFDFDPVLQIRSRLEQLRLTGHLADKIELIVIGGTFSNYPASYKREFFKQMIDTVNGFVSPDLSTAQEANEAAAKRIVGISIETRPDWLDAAEVKLLRELGVTKVQVGVQAFDEAILRRIKRGHSLESVAQATQLLKDAGIKVCYHYMPNLPLSTPEKDIEMARLMFEDPRFKPDFLKVYPAQVIAGTELYREWQRGEYQPYPDELLKEVLKSIKKLTPPWVRIDRLVRDISKQWVSAGTHATNMRQVIQAELLQEGISCRCIRCREVRRADSSAQPLLRKQKIATRGGEEYFVTFESQDRLYSLLRLRLPDRSSQPLFSELANSAIIREVHTFGRTVAVGDRQDIHPQHRGLGSRLLMEAERLAARAGYPKIAVISAIGTRGYYRKFGYKLQGLYMVKSLGVAGAVQ